MKKKYSSYLLVPAACALVAIAAQVSTASAEEKKDEKPAAGAMPSPVVGVDTAKTEKFNPVHNYKGRLISPGQVAVVPQVAGTITEVAFTEGMTLEKGAALYKIDDVKYKAAMEAARAQLAQCEATRTLAQKTLERTKVLFERKVTSAQNMDAAISDAAASEAAYNAAKAALIAAEDDFKHCTITAPIAGKIGLNAFTVGNYVTTASGALTTIVQQDPMRLAFSMSNRDFLRYFDSEETLKKNFTVRIRLADGSLYETEGSVEFVDNKANLSTDTISVYARFANPGNKLFAGATVSVEVQEKEPADVVAVPLSAIVHDNKGSYVWVLDEENKPARRDITPGATTTEYGIVSEGLSAGERIVSTGTHKVIPGVAVQPVVQKAD